MERQLLPVGEVLKKMQHFCAYQDRCHKEVREKLSSYDMKEDEREWVMCSLVEDRFLDEERFARSFVRGKHRFKGWGVSRLTQELRIRDIHPRLITMALSEINEQEYAFTFEKLASQKIKAVGGVDTQAKKAKVYNYLISKGYAPNMIWDVLNVK